MPSDTTTRLTSATEIADFNSEGMIMKTCTIFAALLISLVGLTGTAWAETFQERRPVLFDRLDVNDNGHLGRYDYWARRDRDNNPPGRLGGQGTNWENPPGPRGGRGTSPDRRWRRDRDNNPPGRLGGRGTNWENPPGPRGGRGTSPNRRRRR
jgi:hypothetical protein